MNVHVSKYGHGIPVVFFHGWGFDRKIWEHLIPFLEKEIQLILVDLPGFGLTPMMNWESFKSNLFKRIPEQFHLVGWSMGGLYATRLAIESPTKVKRLLNITSSPHFIKDQDWPGVEADVFSHFYNNLSKDIKSTLNEFISLQMNYKNLSIPLGSPPSSEGLQHGLTILGEWDFRNKINQLTMPVAYYFGRLDPITPVKVMEKMQLIYPDLHYVLYKKAAHMPFLSHTDLFIKDFLEFIK
ncbi:alpha/beta fold hydrolase [Legionella waltersii]|uniref:Pimeloyl-[acyl-carrier protein] methyl ester esterase n=1 Tax=Legionella waltersii TaxID=66969 RepID=A0A0W1A175_9GAMM|nr:alpha/beta fold hydrolase [Legionella waltersii]KTD75121.1 biotin biosynthesis protein BioH [Legionella waltersii]SNV04969.1 biotin operon repressor and biotin [Legionella waltersii]